MSLVLVISLSGCMTILASFDDDNRPLPPMAGTRLWYEAVNDEKWAIFAIFLFPDLPLSFIADVALLPLTVPLYLHREFWMDEK